jgi:broad specificity phosphatase PhoE
VSAPLQLYLIRHGETAWSLNGQHTGRTDLPLTLHGQQMARGLARALSRVAFVQVLTSPRLRARDTCEHAGLGAQAGIEPALAEWDYGDYEGLRTAEIHRRRPDWDLWMHGCPGGELPASAGARADGLLARLLVAEGPVALFTHGQFARVLAARWIGLAVDQGRHFAVEPASIGILSFERAHPLRRVIALWNSPASGLYEEQPC